MGLIVLMFALQTIHNICDWYIMWLGFIYYGDAPDQALDALQVDEGTSLILRLVGSMFDLLAVLRLAIADGIMVSTHLSLPVNNANSLQLKVWRCWIICNSSWRAAIVPLVFDIGSIGMCLLLGTTDS